MTVGAVTPLIKDDTFKIYRERFNEIVALIGGVQKHANEQPLAPSTSDDSSEGYDIGSTWIHDDTANSKKDFYVCVDNTDDSASWLRVGSTDMQILRDQIDVYAKSEIDTVVQGGLKYVKNILNYNASEFRIDESPAQAAEPKLNDGQTVHEMIFSNILHFGDGYMPLQATGQANLKLVAEMSGSAALTNFKLVIRVYNSNNSLLRTTIVDDITAPTNTTEFEVDINGILQAGDTTVDIEGRVEVEYLQAATDTTALNILMKKAIITYV